MMSQLPSLPFRKQIRSFPHALVFLQQTIHKRFGFFWGMDPDVLL